MSTEATPKGYDSVAVRELLRSAPGHRAMPNGDFVLSLAAQLNFAESALATQAVQVRKAHEETAAIQLRIDSLVEADRKLRAETQGHAQLIAALKTIAANPKGAAKLASQALLAAGLVEPVSTTT